MPPRKGKAIAASPDRLTRLEATVESLASTVSRLETVANALVNRRTDWVMVGVMLTVAIFLVGALIFGPITNLQNQVDDGKDEQDIARVEAKDYTDSRYFEARTLSQETFSQIYSDISKIEARLDKQTDTGLMLEAIQYLKKISEDTKVGQ